MHFYPNAASHTDKDGLMQLNITVFRTNYTLFVTNQQGPGQRSRYNESLRAPPGSNPDGGETFRTRLDGPMRPMKPPLQ